MQRRNALLAAVAVALPFAAQAQPVTGLYVGAGLGVNFLSQEKVEFSNSGSQRYNELGGSSKLKSEVGFGSVLSVGWGFGNGLRVEVEGNYRDNKFNGTTGVSVNSGHLGFVNKAATAGGWEQKYGGMVNALYDFNNVVPWMVPYVGAGVGYVWANEQNFTVYGPTNYATTYLHANETKGSFAYQAILGAAFPIAAMPGLAVTAEYRFMGLEGDRSYSGTETIAYSHHTVGPISATAKMTDNYNNAILIGLRYNFGVAPPPPPAPAAAPAPAPARSYLVFFDWDKATLTPRAQQIIKEAADNSTKVKYTQIEVNGYTDTSGTAQYNQGLSVRRAQAVAAELVKDGVPKNAIAIQGFGETHLLVPTGNGVREPQNRRVEIIIR